MRVFPALNNCDSQTCIGPFRLLGVKEILPHCLKKFATLKTHNPKKIRIHYSVDQSSPLDLNEPTHHVSPIFEPRHPASCSLSQTEPPALPSLPPQQQQQHVFQHHPFLQHGVLIKFSTTIFYNNNLSSHYNITWYPCNCNFTIIIATLILPPYCPQSSGLWRQNRIPLVQATVATPITTLPNLRRKGFWCLWALWVKWSSRKLGMFGNMRDFNAWSCHQLHTNHSLPTSGMISRGPQLGGETFSKPSFWHPRLNSNMFF